ncbi:MAG: NUDIX domain-containing protein [Thermoplasmata archaeon]|nr:NUDIX domain-containing protein [Thermoplasmata archaeon]
MASAPIEQECVEGYVYVAAPFRLLILRRPPSRDRIWVPVSGKVEGTDRDYPSALRRELQEETGFTDVRRLYSLDWEVSFEGPKGARWRLHAFGVEVPAPWAPILSAEHEAFAWVSAAEAKARLHYPDNQRAVDRLLERAGGAHPPSDGN